MASTKLGSVERVSAIRRPSRKAGITTATRLASSPAVRVSPKAWFLKPIRLFEPERGGPCRERLRKRAPWWLPRRRSHAEASVASQGHDERAPRAAAVLKARAESLRD